ncbi:MAG: hypothetical protein O3B87_02675 [bacterium]|nr:hypothetical protein [bacterium]
MPNDQITITLEAMQQMFRESEERLENRLVEKFESEFLNIYRKIDSIQGLIRFLDHKVGDIKSDIDILKREAIQINKRLDNLENRFDSLETRFDNLENRFDSLETRFDNLENRFDSLEIQIDKRFDGMANGFLEFTSVTFDNHNNRITALEQNKHLTT